MPVLSRTIPEAMPQDTVPMISRRDTVPISDTDLPGIGTPVSGTVHFIVDFADNWLEQRPMAENDIQEGRTLEQMVALYDELIATMPDDMIDIELPSDF